MTAERMLELELKENEFYFGEVDYLRGIGFNIDDINYMKIAHCLPYCEILEAMEEYDKSSPKIDELLLVSNLAKKYKVQRILIIERLFQIRKIYDYINGNEKKYSKKRALKQSLYVM